MYHITSFLRVDSLNGDCALVCYTSTTVFYAALWPTPMMNPPFEKYCMLSCVCPPVWAIGPQQCNQQSLCLYICAILGKVDMIVILNAGYVSSMMWC